MNNKFFRNFVFFILIIILSYWAIKPILRPGYFTMHDDTQPSRIYAMADALRSGQFPVRWVDYLGYGLGYPIFNFYAPLPYYIGSFFNLIGFDILISTKIMFLIGILLAGVTMFCLVRYLMNDFAGLVSATLYLYAPYHAVNIYIRGAVGEFYAYGLLPLVLLGIYKIMSNISKRERNQGICLASIGIALVILSHNILGMLTIYFYILSLFIYMIFSLHKKANYHNLRILLFTLILGIGLTSFFVFPSIIEKKFTRVDTLIQKGSDYHNHFVYLDQLWDSSWGYAGSTLGRSDGMSFKIGKLHIILGLFGIFLFSVDFFHKKYNFDNSKLIFVINILFALSIYFMLDISNIFWKKLPWFPYIQYPWRFINYTLLSLSILSSAIYLYIPKKYYLAYTLLIIIIILFYNTKYYTPQLQYTFSEEKYISKNNLQFSISKISDEYTAKEFNPPKNLDEMNILLQKDNDIKSKILSNTPTEKKLEIITSSPIKYLANIAYFPGWEGYVDNTRVNLSNNSGRLGIDLPVGTHEALFKFKDTPLRLVANLVSLFSLILLVYISLFTSKDSLWLIRKPLK